MTINGSIKKQALCLLILITTCYLICFFFVFMFTKRHIDTKAKNYLNSTSSRLRDKVESIIKEKTIFLNNANINLLENKQRNMVATDKELLGLFTRYQFNRDYVSLRYVDVYGKNKIYFEGGYVKEINAGTAPDFIVSRLKNINPNNYSVLAGNSGTFFVIYRPHFKTSEGNGDENYSIEEHDYNNFYNEIESVVYEEENRNKINWLVGFERGGKVIWSPYKKLQNQVLNGKLNNSSTINIGSETYYVTSIPISHADWNIIAAVPRGPILRPLLLTYAFVLLFALASTLIFVLSLKYIEKRLLKPIAFLERATRDVASGKYEVGYSHEFNNELGHLAKSFQEMVIKIKEYQAEIAKSAHLASIGSSTAMIAHDVRRPLASMRALLKVLSSGEIDEADRRKMITGVEGSIAQTIDMLNDVMVFSKGAESLKRAPQDALAVVNSGIVDALRNHEGSDVKVEWDLGQGATGVHIDGPMVTRAITNIVDNALDAMAVTKDSKIAQGTIWVKAEALARSVKITITDSGPGIPEDILPTVLDPFVTHGKKGGTGLGLAICKRVIELHGGKIEVRNRCDGKIVRLCDSSQKPSNHRTIAPSGQAGAEFTIELPSATGEYAAFSEGDLICHSSELEVFEREAKAREELGDTANREEFMRINKERGRKSHLLVVDDEPLFRVTIREALNKLEQVRDHVVIIEADTAEKALELLAGDDRPIHFDYAICDIELMRSRMNGYRLAQKILNEYPNTYVLIHSNKRKSEMDEEIREAANKIPPTPPLVKGGEGGFQSRFLGFLPKPMKSSELLQFLACRSFETSHEVGEGLRALPTRAATEGRPYVQGGKEKKILILNDDEDFNMGMKMDLKMKGYQVQDATNVGDALTHLTDNKFDIIISDVNLGVGWPDGYDFLKAVREKDKNTPFIFTSGYPKDDHWPKAEELGATGYLQLPFDMKELLRIL